MAVPNGLPSTGWFEWGHLGNYEHTTASIALGAGASVVPVQLGLNQLTESAAYQYRLVVSNAAGITYGATQWFTTGSKLADVGLAGLPPGTTNLVEAVAGEDHCITLDNEGMVNAWGPNNIAGQASVPAGLSNVVSVSSGNVHNVVLLGDGTVAAWGYNYYGQGSVPEGLSNVFTVVGGGDHNLALLQDGTVVAWGRNDRGQATVPTGLSNVVSVACGPQYSVALKADGTIACWGNEALGVANAPVGLSNVVAIAAHGGSHALALKNDGSVVTWGDSSGGLEKVPPTLTNVVVISTGSGFSMAVSANGALTMWGNTVFAGNYASALSNVVAASGGQFFFLALAGNVAPVANPVMGTGYANSDLTITLRASDINGDLLSFRIASLPDRGALYQYNGGTRGTLITSNDAPVEDTLGRVVFVPAGNSYGSPEATFSYVADDGESQSPPATVTININLPAAPQLNAMTSTRTSSNEFQINFSGTVDATYRVWCSSNLVDWEALGTATMTAPGVFQFSDPTATDAPIRFYRAGAP